MSNPNPYSNPYPLTTPLGKAARKRPLGRVPAHPPALPAHSLLPAAARRALRAPPPPPSHLCLSRALLRPRPCQACSQHLGAAPVPPRPRLCSPRSPHSHRCPHPAPPPLPGVHRGAEREPAAANAGLGIAQPVAPGQRGWPRGRRARACMLGVHGCVRGRVCTWVRMGARAHRRAWVHARGHGRGHGRARGGGVQLSCCHAPGCGARAPAPSLCRTSQAIRRVKETDAGRLRDEYNRLVQVGAVGCARAGPRKVGGPHPACHPISKTASKRARSAWGLAQQGAPLQLHACMRGAWGLLACWAAGRGARELWWR